MIEGNDPVTGHIISTTIGGKNGEPKKVIFRGPKVIGHYQMLGIQLYLS
jgi:protein brassinosteroid insensitive 2